MPTNSGLGIIDAQSDLEMISNAKRYSRILYMERTCHDFRVVI